MGTKRKSSSSKLQQLEQKPKPQPPSSSSEEEQESDSESESERERERERESNSSSSEESEDESTKRENIRKLLEPFTKDQIIQLFKSSASSTDPTLLSRVKTLADSDPTHRKIFVHGLGYDATPDQLLAAFEPYGEIEECKLITDKVTGKAKGYGFVLFKTRVGSKRALKEPQKKIGNRNTSCQLAAVGPAGAAVESGGGRKIYVGNVGPDVNIEKLRAFFEKFGEIEEGPLGFDKDSRKFKGFAIFVYRNVDGVNKALEEPMKLFDGCQLFCKKFVENSKNSNNNNSSNSNVTNQVVQQQNDSTMSYGFGMNPGMLSGAVPLLMGQSMGFGVNPVLGFNPTFGGIGASYGINSISPGVVGSYGLQGLGAYPAAQMGQPSFGGTAAVTTVTTPAKDSSGVGSAGAAYPSYLGR